MSNEAGELILGLSDIMRVGLEKLLSVLPEALVFLRISCYC